MTVISAASVRVPRTYKEAMTTPQASGWHTATYAEFDALLEKGVYQIVTLPPDAKALPSKIVYKAKPTPTGDLHKLKARVVVRGDQQRPGDYSETFSPTARSTSIRILLAICTLLGWVTGQSDVYVAFLNAILKEKLYVIPPQPMKLAPGQAWLLIKSLYGLVQSPRMWYDTLTAKLIDMGFRVSAFDPCVYIHAKKQLIISVHVDDIRIYAANQQLIDEFREELSDTFTITSEDPDALYLGMHIEHDHGHGTIKIHQSEYVRRLTDRFDFTRLPTAKTPCDHRDKLHRDDKNTATAQFRKEYLQKFGSLNYLPAMTRIDLAYAASLYGRYNANPNQTHLDAITRAYAYVQATREVGITYMKEPPQLLGYCDADWAGCPDTRRSTTGYVFTLAGGPVSWSSTVQKVVALSTCEAEYMALAEAVKEALWITRFINDLQTDVQFTKFPITIHVDNESAIKLSKNPEFHQRSKHIDIRHHFLREHIRNGNIKVTWISGKENPADMLTKPLDHIKFSTICQNLGLLPSTTQLALTTVYHTPYMLDDYYTRQIIMKLIWTEQHIEDTNRHNILESEWLALTYNITSDDEEEWYNIHILQEMQDDWDEQDYRHISPWEDHLVYGEQLPDYDSDSAYSLHGTKL
jgi:ribonuclease HI